MNNEIKVILLLPLFTRYVNRDINMETFDMTNNDVHLLYMNDFTISLWCDDKITQLFLLCAYSVKLSIALQLTIIILNTLFRYCKGQT